jgi:NADPH-dependent 7-cyano-7-deazaguanine reductase QueF
MRIVVIAFGSRGDIQPYQHQPANRSLQCGWHNLRMLQAELKTIPNHVTNRTYTVTLHYAAFRCQQEVNPALANFAQLTIDYAPNELLYDFGSLMSYLRSFEAESLSLETAANRIVDDLFAHLRPIWAKVVIALAREHGLKIEIQAEQGHLS